MAHPTTQVNDALVARIEMLRRAFAASLSAARRGDERAVHAGRVAARRLREALAIVAVAAPSADVKPPGRALRRMRRALGPMREADVMQAGLEIEQSRRRWPAAAVSALRNALAAERKSRARRAARTLRGASGRLRLRSTITALEAQGDDRHLRHALATRARRRARALAKTVARAGTIYDPARLHAVRLAAKKLRYVLEVAEATGAWRAGREIDRLRGIQDVLGHLNDIEVLRAFVRRTADGAAARGGEAAGFEAIERDLEVESRRLHAAVVRDLPALALLAGAIAAGSPGATGGRGRMLRMAPKTAAGASRRPAVRDRKART